MARSTAAAAAAANASAEASSGRRSLDAAGAAAAVAGQACRQTNGAHAFSARRGADLGNSTTSTTSSSSSGGSSSSQAPRRRQQQQQQQDEQAAAAASPSAAGAPRRRASTAALFPRSSLLLIPSVLLLLLLPHPASAVPPDYDPLAQNRTCTYTARGVQASIFFKGGPTAGQVRDLIDADPKGAAATAATASSAESSSSGVRDSSHVFPLDPGSPAFSRNSSVTAATACFGPGETYDPALVAAGTKHNCRWRWSPRTAAANGGGKSEGGNGGESESESGGSSAEANSRNAADPNALIDYEEEQACLPVLTSNCYCYSVGRSVGSYCDPGLAGLGEGVSFPIDECAPVVKGVVADGGRPITSEEIRAVQAGRQRPPLKGHYIALAVMPSWEDKFNTGGDFHFWRMDSSLGWSYKAGDTFVRHTVFPGTGPPSLNGNSSSASGGNNNANGGNNANANAGAARNSGFGLVQAAPALRDLEDPAARGPYSKFCGYFHVDPRTHRLGAGSGYAYSEVPVRYGLWQSATAGGLLGPEASVSVLPRDAGPSEGWLGLYRKDYVDLGWCDDKGAAPSSANDGSDARESGQRASGVGGGGGAGGLGGNGKRARSAVPAGAREVGRRRALVARPAV